MIGIHHGCAANAITRTLASLWMAGVTNARGSRTPTDSLLDAPPFVQYDGQLVINSKIQKKS